MSVYVKYTSQPTCIEQYQIISLLSDAFVNQTISSNTRVAFFSGYKCDYDNFVLLKKDNALIGVAIVAKRKINLLKGVVDALTIGPVAITANFRRKGYSKILMAGVDQLADKFNVSVLYLQGIDGFYNIYSYYTCSSKSKFIFNINEVDEVNEVSIKPLEDSHNNELQEIYSVSASKCSCSSLRTLEDWNWLVNYACKTWYFFEPTMILNNNKPIGYFCSDPDDYGRIREAVCIPSEKGVRSLLAGLKIHCQKKAIENFEVMTWFNSELYNFSKKNCNTSFIQFFKKNGSQMMKIKNFDQILPLINNLLPSNFVLENITSEKGISTFKFDLDGSSFLLKGSENFLPGLITGFHGFDFLENFFEMPSEFKLECENFKNRLDQPFFFQGDNY